MNFIVGSCWIYFSMAFWLWAAGSGPALLCSSFWRILRCRHAKINVTIYIYVCLYFLCLLTYLCNNTYVTMDMLTMDIYIYIILYYVLYVCIIYICDCMCKYVCVCNWVRVDKRPTGDSDTLSFPLKDTRLGEPQDFNWGWNFLGMELIWFWTTASRNGIVNCCIYKYL